MMKRLLCLLLCCLAVFPALAQEKQRPVMQVHQMNIGFADGYLIRCGEVAIVVDGGNANPKVPTTQVMDYLRAAGVTRLTAYIATHWHLDHCMNMNLILEQFGDEETLVYGPTMRPFHEFMPLAKGRYRQMVTGDVLHFGGMTLYCVGPYKLCKEGRQNEDSLNFVLEYGSRRFFFTGDAAANGHVLGEYRELCENVDVLKFPHHGMKPYAIGNKAVRVVSPEYVMVPGVVHKNTLRQFFRSNGVDMPVEHIFSVDDGNVVFLTDGKTLEFRRRVPLSELEVIR